jgi:hypothetical protein
LKINLFKKKYSTKHVPLLLLFLILESPNFSFGIPGPYSHKEIELKVYAEFAVSKNIELNFLCTNSISQFNFQSDVFFPKNDQYHCDNSNFVGCSSLFHELITDSYKVDTLSGLRKIGLALHIVQDFYAHSNWVEIVENSQTLAPFEMMRNPTVLLLFPNLQSGLVGYIPIEIEDQYECYFEKQNRWKYLIAGATHSCMEKDSNNSQRGGALSFGVPTKTYHELAGELAVKHSVRILNELFTKNNPALLSCLTPKLGKTGCNHIVQRKFF